MDYEILENADTVSFSEIESHFNDFVKKYVFSNRKDRWLTLFKNPKKLSKKFSDLWDHLDTDKSSPLVISKLPEDDWLYYHWLEEEDIYKINTKDIQAVCVNSDGIAFSPKNRLVIFFTHECTEYVFDMREKK